MSEPLVPAFFHYDFLEETLYENLSYDFYVLEYLCGRFSILMHQVLN